MAFPGFTLSILLYSMNKVQGGYLPNNFLNKVNQIVTCLTEDSRY
jgi:hypothetical protein